MARGKGLSPTRRHKRHTTPTVNLAEMWRLWLPGPGEDGYSRANIENCTQHLKVAGRLG